MSKAENIRGKEVKRSGQPYVGFIFPLLCFLTKNGL